MAADRLSAVMACVLASVWAVDLPAADLQLTARGADRAPLADLVVVLSPAAPVAAEAAAARQPGPWLMDQVQMQFEPEVLVVPAGAEVSFPNSDSVAHQVYSFSPTRRFSLGLYRGKRYPPVDFSKPGLVVLGCNIHDSMVGYIFVADSPFFGKTNEAGELRLTGLPAGTYSIKVWSARFKGEEPELLQQISLKATDAVALSLNVSRPLLPPRAIHSHPKGMRY